MVKKMDLHNKDERKKEYDRKYYIEHRVEKKEYRIKHKEKIKEYNRKYHIAKKEEIKEQHKEHYIENRKRILERQGKYYIDNKDEILEKQRKYEIKRRAEKPWITHHHCAKQRCTDPNCKDFPRYGGRGICFLITVDEVRDIYLRDNAKDMEKPSIDRIDNDGNYIYGNCRFIEVAENTAKRHMENKRRIK